MGGKRGARCPMIDCPEHRLSARRTLAHCQNHSARVGLRHAVMAGIRQNGRKQNQWVVAGSNPAAPTTPGRTRKATDDDGMHPRAAQRGRGAL